MSRPNESIWSKVRNAVTTTAKKLTRSRTVPNQLTRIRQDAETRRQAVSEAEQDYFPFRVKMQRLYLNTSENGYIMACIDRRKDLTLLRKWEFKNSAGNVDEKVMAYFFDIVDGKPMKKEWFNNFLSYVLDAEYYGYSLIFLGDIENGEYKGTCIEKRWLVSPDRYMISPYENMIHGDNFMTDENIKDNYVYVSTPNKIGTSPCGYGLFYELSIYEIFLRNLMGFNGDFIEVNIAPFRQIKSYTTEESERDKLEQVARDMGSNGYAVTEPEVEIVFHPSGGSGTGYNAYDNFEKRLESKIAQVVLGHADAMSSIPGKLGNDNGESPAQQALEDKQTRDGEFVLAIVNKMLLPRMRAHGFMIPDDVKGCLMNDNEEDELANNITDLAVKMKSAGLQMDAKYFTEKTKIPVAEQVAMIPKQALPSNISNRLSRIYG